MLRRYSRRPRRSDGTPRNTAVANPPPTQPASRRRSRASTAPGDLDGHDILAAFRRPPDPRCDTSGAIGWLLESIRIPEFTKLAVRCGVAYEDLAAHLRAQVRQRPDLVRYLNQYAIPDTTRNAPNDESRT